MSLLDEIKKKKMNLSHTKTLSKSVSGGVYEEDLLSGTREFKGLTHGYVVDTKPDLEVAQVLPGLLMGSQDVALNEALLAQHDITHVLSVGVQVPHYPGFFYTYIEALDLPEFHLLNVFHNCFKVIDGVRKQKKNIYVHCNAGVSRSASVVIAYLMKESGMNYKTAYDFLKTVRSSIKPNEGFIKQLLEYERSLNLNNNSKN